MALPTNRSVRLESGLVRPLAIKSIGEWMVLLAWLEGIVSGRTSPLSKRIDFLNAPYVGIRPRFLWKFFPALKL